MTFEGEPLDPSYATPWERGLTRRLYPLTYDRYEEDDCGDQLYDRMRDLEYDEALEGHCDPNDDAHDYSEYEPCEEQGGEMDWYEEEGWRYLREAVLSA